MRPQEQRPVHSRMSLDSRSICAAISPIPRGMPNQPSSNVPCLNSIQKLRQSTLTQMFTTTNRKLHTRILVMPCCLRLRDRRGNQQLRRSTINGDRRHGHCPRTSVPQRIYYRRNPPNSRFEFVYFRRTVPSIDGFLPRSTQDDATSCRPRAASTSSEASVVTLEASYLSADRQRQHSIFYFGLHPVDPRAPSVSPALCTLCTCCADRWLAPAPSLPLHARIVLTLTVHGRLVHRHRSQYC
ncbi:hypothetical protein C8Q80DRAFT_108159 [Daedaleopsis nitida]|nr:hypothetical protein C8Q80DRAFT_108159 [Daedaleopsis nitida]